MVEVALQWHDHTIPLHGFCRLKRAKRKTHKVVEEDGAQSGLAPLMAPPVRVGVARFPFVLPARTFVTSARCVSRRPDRLCSLCGAIVQLVDCALLAAGVSARLVVHTVLQAVMHVAAHVLHPPPHNHRRDTIAHTLRSCSTMDIQWHGMTQPSARKCRCGQSTWCTQCSRVALRSRRGDRGWFSCSVLRLPIRSHTRTSWALGRTCHTRCVSHQLVSSTVLSRLPKAYGAPS